MRHSYKTLKDGDVLGHGGTEAPSRRKLWKRSIVAVLAVVAFVLLLYVAAPPANDDRHHAIEKEGDRLLFVAVLHRHGARTGLHHFTFENFTWPWKFGALTPEGMRMGFEMGQKLRTDYWPHLSSGSSKLDINVTSTDYPRTIDTVHSLLVGLFLEGGNEADVVQGNCSCRPEFGGKAAPVDCIGKCLGLDSVPTHLPPVKVLNASNIEASLLRQHDVCKEYQTWKLEWNKSEEYKTALKDFSKQIDFVKQVVDDERLCADDPANETMGGNASTWCDNITLYGVEMVWDSAVCALAEGMDYPSPTNHTDLINRLQPTVEFLQHHLYNVQQGPYVGGILLNDILVRMKAAEGTASVLLKSQNRKMGTITSAQGASMAIYSAHDSTVSSLLAALGMKNWTLPYFIAHITMELWAADSLNVSGPRVVLKYNDGREDHVLDIEGCSNGECSFKSLLNATADRRSTMADCTFVEDTEP
ncbi:unnamed protein product [Ostreobium quekettii]|uniref:Acid phosphatase n=1 Tax=Ostreobium quekettii TaxID=121088 RepID=A0A8S1IKA6_9CHLO|nr:unnamed protein product [Ostreobium quekettii]|eukprot:evm.model.scf_218.4 EVM.evm.TU.scf_218.4   scf_218:24600-30592(-)